MKEYKPDQYVIYLNGDSVELGLIKRVVDDGAFVWYHGGETAAKTPFECMRPLRNAYAIKHTSLGGAAAIDGCWDAPIRELLNEDRPIPTALAIKLLDAYDAAVDDLRIVAQVGEPCATCKHGCNRGDNYPCAVSDSWCGGLKWKWRGPRPGGEVTLDG